MLLADLDGDCLGGMSGRVTREAPLPLWLQKGVGFCTRRGAVYTPQSGLSTSGPPSNAEALQRLELRGSER